MLNLTSASPAAGATPLPEPVSPVTHQPLPSAAACQSPSPAVTPTTYKPLPAPDDGGTRQGASAVTAASSAKTLEPCVVEEDITMQEFYSEDHQEDQADDAAVEQHRLQLDNQIAKEEEQSVVQSAFSMEATRHLPATQVLQAEEAEASHEGGQGQGHCPELAAGQNQELSLSQGQGLSCSYAAANQTRLSLLSQSGAAASARSPSVTAPQARAAPAESPRGAGVSSSGQRRERTEAVRRGTRNSLLLSLHRVAVKELAEFQDVPMADDSEAGEHAT